MCKENNPLSCLWKCTLATDNNIWIVSECTNNKKKLSRRSTVKKVMLSRRVCVWCFRRKKQWDTSPSVVVKAHFSVFHSTGSWLPKASACSKNQRRASKSAAALWTFPVTTTDHPCLLAPLIHKRWAAALDGCPQEMSCGGYCKIKTQTQNNF